MPGLDALEILQSVNKQGVETDIIIITGFGTAESAVKAKRWGAKDFLKKPFRTKELVNVVGRPIDARHPSPSALGQRLEKYVKDHAFNPSLRITDLCEYFSISPRYVSKILKERVGVSFKRLLSEQRVERAKQLIETTDEPLYAIADQCGFSNYRQLTTTFKKLEDLLPTSYRVLHSKH